MSRQGPSGFRMRLLIVHALTSKSFYYIHLYVGTGAKICLYEGPGFGAA
jgi:hypothetical protein